jgi:zinc transport system permease protein
MIDDFLMRALIAGLGVAAVAGPLGCFVVWRRMAYFGDSLAHSALLGIALGILLGVSLTLGVIIIVTLLAVLLVLLQSHSRLASDTLLGMMSHGSLALGLVVLSFFKGIRIDLMGYLFGDILAVSLSDIYWIFGGGIITLLLLARIWQPLLLITIHEGLAQAEGVRVFWIRLIYVLLVALVVALGMKVVGILLMTALLIIPAAAARQIARTPETMALLAALCGAAAVMAGLSGSLTWDTPAGPSVVVAALLVFVVCLGANHLRRLV